MARERFDVPSFERLRQRLLCVAPTAALSTGTGGWGTEQRIRAIDQYS
jgi:hypothetical protein